ncbi:MAG: MFS transporter [Candidatus Heimdallarchaeota archaeon]
MKDSQLKLGLTETNDKENESELLAEEENDPNNSDEFGDETSVQKSRSFLYWLTNIFSNNSVKQFYVGLQAFTAFLGISGTLMGFLNAIPNLFGLLQGFFGRLSDKYGRKVILIVSFFILTISSTILIFFTHPAVIVVVVIFQAFSVAVISPVWYATLGDIAPEKTKATFLGKLAAVTSIVDLVISTILTVLFYLADSNTVINGTTIYIPVLWQTRIAFIIASLTALGAALVALIIKETRLIEEEDEEKIKQKSRFTVVFKDKSYMKYVIISCCFTFFGTLPWGVFNLVMVNVLSMTFWKIMLFLTSITIFRSFIQFLGGKLSDKLARRKPLIIIGAMMAPSMAFFVVISSATGLWWLMFIDLLISSVGIGLINVLLLAYVLDIAPKDLRGTYIGTLYSFQGITAFIAMLIGGAISDALINNYSYYIMAIALFLGAGIGQFLSSFGFFFIDESIKNENLQAD